MLAPRFAGSPGRWPATRGRWPSSITAFTRSPSRRERLIHVDFHPDNVLLSERGPVVIDWANSRSGKPAFDVAMTWVIVATSGGAMGVCSRGSPPARRRSRGSAELPAAGEFRIADPNVTDAERERVRRLTRIAS